jgi:Amt family ammonium transporter
VIAKVISIFTPLRASVDDERRGLDISQHGENAYPSFNGLD